jgi:hypothetical protein
MLAGAAGSSMRAHAGKKKTCFRDFYEEFKQEQEEEEARAAEVAAGRSHRESTAPPTGAAAALRFKRTLHREELMPLVDLAYSESASVQRSAIGLLATLSMNSENKDMLMEAGSLKPLITCCVEGTDTGVRRHALSGLAHMTQREDIRSKLCAVPGGLRACVQGVWSRDLLARLAAAEVCANVAASLKLRGQLVAADVLPALASLLSAKTPELKRKGMVALQRLALSSKGTVGGQIKTKEDPEGDGYAAEIMEQGLLVPLLGLLRGGPHIDEELRTQAMRTVYEMAHSSDEMRTKFCTQAPDDDRTSAPPLAPSPSRSPSLVAPIVLWQAVEVVRVSVGLLLLDGSSNSDATQREACRVVQLLAAVHDNLKVLVKAGILQALGAALALTCLLAARWPAAHPEIRWVETRLGSRARKVGFGRQEAGGSRAAPALRGRRRVPAGAPRPRRRAHALHPRAHPRTQGRASGRRRALHALVAAVVRGRVARGGRGEGARDARIFVRPRAAPGGLQGVSRHAHLRQEDQERPCLARLLVGRQCRLA